MNNYPGQGPGMGGRSCNATQGKSGVLNELKCADQRAQTTAKAIEKMREFIEAQAKKECLNDDDAKELQAKQCELMEKMSEFEAITKQIQRLVSMNENQCPQAAMSAPEEKLPKVIICSGCPEDEIPKIIVCESTKKDGKHPPTYQQFPGKAPCSSPCDPPAALPKQQCGALPPRQQVTFNQNQGERNDNPCKAALSMPMASCGSANQAMGSPCPTQRVPTVPIGLSPQGAPPGGLSGVLKQMNNQGPPLGMNRPNQFMGMQNGPQFGGMVTGQRNQPMGNMFQPMGGTGQQMRGMGQQMGGLGQPMGGMGQRMGGMCQSMGGMGQSMGGMGQPMGGMGQQMGGMGQQMGGTGQQMGGMGQPMGGMGQPMGGMGQQMGGMGQMGMMGQQRSPLTGRGGCGSMGQGTMGATGPQIGGGKPQTGCGGVQGVQEVKPPGEGAAPQSGCGSVFPQNRKPHRTLQETPQCTCSDEKSPKPMGGCGGKTSCGDGGGGGGKAEIKNRLASDSVAGPGGDYVPEALAGPSGTKSTFPASFKKIVAAPTNVSAPLAKERQTTVVNHLTDQLATSYKLQEKLAIENAEMEGTRYQLQQQLMCKDQAVDNLKKKVENLQHEMRQVCNENNELKTKIAADHAPVFPDKPLCKMKLGNQPVCKMEIYNQMGLPVPKTAECMGDGGGAEATRTMEVMVASMEEEVRSMQKELEMVQQERRNLELQRKLLKCTGPGACQKAQPGPSGGCQKQQTQAMNTCPIPTCPPPPPPPPPPPCVIQLQCQIQQLKEQYCKLQEDYHGKVEEVSSLRLELENAKKESQLSLEKTEEAEARVDDLLDRLKSVESEKTKMTNSKDQLIEMEQQLILAKQRYREAQEELEEQRANVQEQGAQLEEYRQKYLCAQQTVEEQRRQMDILELENCRIGEQVNVEIQRVKASFQEKLQELTPLPEILKATQLKLQECSQLRIIAERNCEELGKEVDELKEANDRLTRCLDEIKNNTNQKDAEKASLQSSLTDGEKKMEETKTENLKLKAVVARLEELAVQNERKYEEKVHECLQLQTQLETLREESARQVSRTKDRCEAARRSLQTQISEMEKQLAQSRAAARSAQRDRDEIRQKMQAQICQLNENFDQAQLRIRTLQSHVNYLKTSYTNIFNPEDRLPCSAPPRPNLESCSPAIEGKEDFF